MRGILFEKMYHKRDTEWKVNESPICPNDYDSAKEEEVEVQNTSILFQ